MTERLLKLDTTNSIYDDMISQLLHLIEHKWDEST